MENTRTFTLGLAFVFLSCLLGQTTGSAIPMWEFLSRDEKMSYLFRMYDKLVAEYCATSSQPDCMKNMLIIGVRNVANMDDNVLDVLDPYQRNAKEMIWRAIVGSERFLPRIDQGEKDYYTIDADHLVTSGSDTNGIAEESVSSHDYIRPTSHEGPYLVGPMVIRVYPDGRPVAEDAVRPLPKDEDAEDLKYPHLPSIEEIQNSKLYGKPKRNFNEKVYNKNYRRGVVAGSLNERKNNYRNDPYKHERPFLRHVMGNGRIVPYY